jgi:hypothetical protein
VVPRLGTSRLGQWSKRSRENEDGLYHNSEMVLGWNVGVPNNV